MSRGVAILLTRSGDNKQAIRDLPRGITLQKCQQAE
jgi:hypothetical protein